MSIQTRLVKEKFGLNVWGASDQDAVFKENYILRQIGISQIRFIFHEEKQLQS